MIRSVNIIGFGKVGSAFCKHLLKEGIEVKSIFTRSLISSIGIGFPPVINDLKQLDKSADLNIIAVVDDAIPEVILHLPKSIPVVHTSGNVSLDVLNGFDKSGILYPLQTITKGRTISLRDNYFLIESTKNFHEEVSEFCVRIFSTKILFCDSEKRAKIHLAAVFANNFTNYLLGSAHELLSQNKVDFQILKPLVKETIDKAFDLGPLESQTGPATRGDETTIARHLNLLSAQIDKDVYSIITSGIKSRSK